VLPWPPQLLVLRHSYLR